MKMKLLLMENNLIAIDGQNQIYNIYIFSIPSSIYRKPFI